MNKIKSVTHRIDHSLALELSMPQGITEERFQELLDEVEEAHKLEDKIIPMISLNNKHEERDRLIFGGTVDWDKEAGGMKRFSSMSSETLRVLIDKGFADPNEKQNLAPALGEFQRFMEDNPGRFLAHGYAISPDRQDYRVSIEGLRSTGKVTRKLTTRFIDFCRCPAELEAGYTLYSWWD